MIKRLKRIVRKNLELAFSKLGFHLIKRDQHNGSTRFKLNGFNYDIVVPYASYAPWLGDDEFLKKYTAIQKNTLVDIYRCFELWELAETIHKLDNTACFLEIGIWKGGTAAVVGRKLTLLNSTVDFYLADTFTGVAKATDKDASYSGGEHSDTSQEIVDILLRGNYNNYKILKGIFPEETSHLISPTQKFGYCHIDVDVYQSAKDIVDWIWEKLIVGGIIVFDDYGFRTCSGITTYVNEQKSKTDRTIIHNLNGHAIMIKLK
jgi:O-methyltransferase